MIARRYPEAGAYKSVVPNIAPIHCSFPPACSSVDNKTPLDTFGLPFFRINAFLVDSGFCHLGLSVHVTAMSQVLFALLRQKTG